MAQSRDQTGSSKPTTVEIEVRARATENGDYTFSFAGSEFVAENGDLDFRPLKTPVEIIFTVARDVERGFRFATPASSAIGIVLEREAPKGRCPATGAARQKQFFGFRLSRDRRTLRVRNHNSDRETYFYALNFNNAKGCAVVLDPMIRNDSSPGFE